MSVDGSGCESVVAVIQTYVDGECTAATSRVVAAHLEWCPACDGEAMAYRWLKAAVRRQRVDDPDAVARLCRFAALLTRRCAG
jgi:anti-sigma factor RsiW